MSLKDGWVPGTRALWRPPRYTVYKDHITLEDYEIHDGMGLELVWPCSRLLLLSHATRPVLLAETQGRPFTCAVRQRPKLLLTALLY